VLIVWAGRLSDETRGDRGLSLGRGGSVTRHEEVGRGLSLRQGGSVMRQDCGLSRGRGGPVTRHEDIVVYRLSEEAY
jgi:hypothetical protein